MAGWRQRKAKAGATFNKGTSPVHRYAPVVGGWHAARYSAPPAPEALVDRATALGIAGILLSCIVLQRFAIPVGGAQIPGSFAASYAIIGVLLLVGRLIVNPPLLLFFLATMALLALSMAINLQIASLASFAYLFTIYVLYVFKLRYRQGSFEYAVHFYQALMAFCAALGIAQFFAQFVLPFELVFPIDNFVPDDFRFTEQFNVIIPLTYESPIMKSNGVLFLEPSFFSQFLGLAIIIELTGRQRLIHLGLYGAAMLVSYSGTGMSMVAIFLPWIFIQRGNLQLLALFFVGGLVVLLGGEAMNLNLLAERFGEFGAAQSSGFARFVSPYFLVRDFLIEDAAAFLFGMGPGSIELVVSKAYARAYLAHDPAWIKLMFEYGVIAAACMLTYIAIALRHGSRHGVLAWAILYLFLFLGGYLLNGMMHALFVALLAWHNDPRGLPARVPETRRFYGGTAGGRPSPR